MGVIKSTSSTSTTNWTKTESIEKANEKKATFGEEEKHEHFRDNIEILVKIVLNINSCATRCTRWMQKYNCHMDVYISVLIVLFSFSWAPQITIRLFVLKLKFQIESKEILLFFKWIYFKYQLDRSFRLENFRYLYRLNSFQSNFSFQLNVSYIYN